MSPPPSSAEFATEREPRLRLLIPLMVATGFLMEQLDTTIITTAVPDMARSLHAGAVQMNVAVSAYVLTLAVFIPLSSWCADRFGARRVFIAALAMFTLGSMLCGLADSLPELVAMRVLQGLGGAMMTPVGRLILLRSFPRRELVRAMTYTTLPALIGPVLGPLLGGALTTYFSWRWIFAVNVPFGLLGIELARRYLRDSEHDRGARFDVVGFVLFGGGVALLQGTLEASAQRGAALPLLAAAAALLLAFGYHARRRREAVVDLSLFRERAFAIGTLAGGLCRIAMNGAAFVLPLTLQLGLGLSPLQSGSLTFATALGSPLIRVALGPLLRRLGFTRLLAVSALAGSAALAGFAMLDAAWSHWMIIGYIVGFGMVRSTQFMSSNTLSYADLEAERLSRATSLGGLLQQLTVSFGVSLGAALLARLAAGHAPVLADFHLTFVLLALLPLLALPGFARLQPGDGAQVSGYRPR
jgi:EmrB/QacA subfamily drug resistance transporter